MKICFVIKSLAGAVGGAERVLCNVVNALAARGHDITLITFDTPEGSSFYPLSPSLSWLKLDIGNTKQKSDFFEFFYRTCALRKHIKLLSPDCTVAFMHSAFIPTAFALIGTNLKLVGSEHIVIEHYKQRPLEYLLLLIAGPFIHTFTVLSNSIRAKYPKFIREKMVVVANPVDMSANAFIPQTNSKQILSVGRLEKQKDYAILIDAFSLLSSRHDDWTLKIVGEGTLRRDIEQQIANLNLQHKVSLPGTSKDIGADYKTAEIFVMPSLYESFGLATVEAMHHGLPVIGFADCPGTNEVILHEENGILVKERHAKNLATAIEGLIQSQDIRKKYGTAGVKTAAKYNINEIVKVWEDVLQSTILK